MRPNRGIALGAYRSCQGRIVGKFVTLVNPESPIPRLRICFTGITNEMVKAAPVFADVAPRWLDFVSDAVLIAHNAPFDTSFLNREISRVYPGHRMVNSHLCTVRLSRRVFPGLNNYRLDTVADHFSIPIYHRHPAGSDAPATADVFLHLLSRFEDNAVTDLAASGTFQFFETPDRDPKSRDSETAPPLLPLVPGF